MPPYQVRGRLLKSGMTTNAYLYTAIITEAQSNRLDSQENEISSPEACFESSYKANLLQKMERSSDINFNKVCAILSRNPMVKREKEE
jgi:hypothetical protein